MIRNCTIIWPSAEAVSITHWGNIAGLLGASATYPMPRPFLIGIRGIRPFEDTSHEVVSKPAYDDTFVLLAADGLARAVVFEGSTHAYQRDSKLSPDVDHDGRGDVATIKPGYYLLEYRGGKYPEFELLTRDRSGRIPAYRDLQHDGTADDGDFTATDVLLHTGYDAPADARHKSSIACQTMRLRDLQVLEQLCRPHGASADYRLITAWELAAMLEQRNTDPAPPLEQA